MFKTRPRFLRCANALPLSELYLSSSERAIMTTLPAGSTNAAIPRPPTDAYNWNPPSEVQQQLVQADGADGNGKPADPYRYNPPSEESDDKVTDSAVPQPQSDKEPESPAVLIVPVVVTPQAPTKDDQPQEDDEDDEDDDDSDYEPSSDDHDDDEETDMEGSDSDPEDTLQEKLAAIDSGDEVDDA